MGNFDSRPLSEDWLHLSRGLFGLIRDCWKNRNGSVGFGQVGSVGLIGLDGNGCGVIVVIAAIVVVDAFSGACCFLHRCCSLRCWMLSCVFNNNNT